MIKVPGFVISQLLGRGTYGQVYMGRKSGSSKLVAIKCIMKLKLSNQARDNLVSEISILKALEHPHIVRMLDFTWDASFVYIIMEFCGGGDLSRFLRLKRRLDELLVQRFLQQLALALQYLKSKNIVHMDLKPQNILLTSINNPSLKLADFGFAQCIKETAKKNEVRGTLLYMAPEIFCEGFYHPSCDLWSIGIILYECLFGTTPYGQITIEKLKEKLVAMDEEIKLPSTNEISKPCAALIHGLLKRNPSERLNHEQFFSHPFIDLDHAPSAQSLDKAAEYLKRAPQLESLGKLCEAYDCYLEGLNHLMAAYNYEPSRFKKSQIRILMKDHLLKTESLKLELCRLSHTDVTSSSSPQLEPKTLNSQAVNLPDPIVPVKCYDVSRQPKKNADSSKKGLFHYLPKEKDDHQSSLKSKSSPTSETYQPQDSGTSDNFTYFRGDCLSTDSVEQINVCLSSDKAGILTRIKHWFSRQNDKTENPYEYSGKASKKKKEYEKNESEFYAFVFNLCVILNSIYPSK
ncbi:Serine/threonine-protein kinase ulk3, variant 2 [Schistosoma haematobium]|uniref:Serine/threonine-protein kinase ULK3 n=1 Tax=Schistosoma haematobium TaxID=6185 RepID=A0A922LGX6_SCHHA|nr:Serine/threonine-protein kinase ulk3, variant 2 [Schistosoma haematobium]KAH9583202.1 Serine/threonine-protein kinase ulk3, variant 2 [Schistosoma haematobium]